MSLQLRFVVCASSLAVDARPDNGIFSTSAGGVASTEESRNSSTGGFGTLAIIAGSPTSDGLPLVVVVLLALVHLTPHLILSYLLPFHFGRLCVVLGADDEEDARQHVDAADLATESLAIARRFLLQGSLRSNLGFRHTNHDVSF